ncbi:hypothetical protein CROQUDRAFT_45986 [Cronartium quercuum f. sp. fusiforme G11]|uniref:SLC26A/SulP transporter domain-containing protein n=1 Tax=Cronartium quercuum f. sp. fusiforme G11 TaxID=708437 RepID=A0A9P6NEE8_9BASI|nr:hypothetical protein CROQUDRAFT_45986 [Cronartium quercuum f. sp. fusiforme G11]
MNPHLITPLKHLRQLILGIPLDGQPESRANRLQTLRSFEPELEAFIEPVSPSSLPRLSTQIVINWAKSFFPFTNWLFKYRPEWIVGDLVAGLTVGMVVIPQGMAYAKLAELPVEFGLYGSFMAVSIYWLFATSKDITIGPVAVMSQLTGTIVSKAAVTLPEVPAHVVASSLAFVSGCILFALGFLRLGFVVDFIPAPAIAAFMTSSAINIIAGQIPTMLGISRRLDTRGPTYMVIIHTIQELPHASIEAIIGLTSLATLCGLKFILPRLSGRGAMRPKVMEVLVCLRSILVLLFYTLLAYLLTLQHPSSPPIAILGHISPGLTVIGPPQLDSKIISTFASSLPAVLIVLVIEHIAIAKSFARINHYTISPSQELIAIGISNIFGPFVGAYPVTGSFSRTALKSKAGVRTPLAGIITGSLVLLAIYALTGVFYYIPNAVISSVIIHAVTDLIVWPPTAYRTFWRVSITDGLLFLAGVCVAIFTNIEIGIYTTVLASLARLLFRFLPPPFLLRRHLQTSLTCAFQF